uniref:CCHC-type domain-containing protein n=1 Tax=Tanacetum cinerariifolium TaxID=118510 RepID=A0A6L2JWP5_TANCI|nr:hypothetical protein [Tanacetum cinerariifolium]
MFSFFSNQSNASQLDNEDLEQIDIDDLEEMDHKWQVEILTKRVKRFIKKIGRKLDLNGKETVGFDRTKVECYNCYRRGHFARECMAIRNQGNRSRDAPTRNAPVDISTTSALVVQDGIGGYDWSFQAEEELTNFSLMAYTSQGSSSSNSEVHTCSKECLKSYEALQKQYDQLCEVLNKSNLEIIRYQIGLKSFEARIAVHEKNKVVYEEDIAFLKYDVQVKDISIKEIKSQLENALKEKYDLKLKLEKFETSSKNLTKLINSQISVIDKTGLGYDGQINEIDLNNIHVNESEVLNNVFDSCENDGDDNQVNDRFKKGEGYHVVPSPYTGNYIPPKANLLFARLDSFVFKSKVSETITSVSKIKTNASKTSKDSLEKPKTIRSSAHLIEEWESDSDYENVFKPKQVKKTFTPSLEKIEFVNARNTTVENENKAKKPRKFSQSPRAAVLTKSGQVPVNAAKQSSHRATTSVSAVRRVNTAASRPNMNNALPTTYSYFKIHSPGNPQYALQDQGIFNSRCSIQMTMKKSYLSDYQEINGGFVAFRGNAKGGKITGKRREFSVARTLQQNCVAERKNKTLIEASRTMLTDSTFPTTFWAEAVNIACYVQNRVLVIKPHNKTPYELLLGKFDEKSNDGLFVGYSINSKAFRVFNTRSKFIEENLHINFLENKPNVARTGPNWMFNFDTLTMSMNYQLVFAGNQANGNASTKANINAGQARKKTVSGLQYVLLPLLTFDSQGPKRSEDEVPDNARKKSIEVPRKENGVQDSAKDGDKNDQELEFERFFGQGEVVKSNSTSRLNIVSSLVNAVSSSFTIVDPGKERAQRNEFESMFGQDKDANGNRMITPVSDAGSTYVNLGGSILVNAATLPNADIPTDPLMPDLEDIANL